MMTINEDSKIKVKRLEEKFGAGYSIAELIELDHRQSRLRREFPHDGNMDHLCKDCMDERVRRELLAKREEMLKNELVGDEVMIRAYGYKTMRKATVEVTEVKKFQGDAEYHVWFNYHGEVRTQDVAKIKRLDVYVDGERLGVWDDGLDDLPPFDRSLPNSAKPVKRMLHEAFSEAAEKIQK